MKWRESHWLRFLKGDILVRVCFVLMSIWILSAYLVYHFESHAEHANIKSLGDAIWWGIVTFLTVGYGDRYPVTTEGRVVASVLMTSGVVSIGIATAKISSYFLEKVLREERGALSMEHLKNHFVICGYKDDLEPLLLHILDFNSDLESSNLVIVAQLTQNIIDSLHATPRLKDIHVVRGDYSNEMILRRAHPERARKVLVLADRTPLPTGQMASIKETDAKTLMTAMTLSHIAKGTAVSAEILDPNMEPYLKMSHVSEIIYSREYNRLLLANASSGTGVSNIIFDLLNPQTPTIITTRPILEKHHGRKYSEIKLEFESAVPGLIVIGVLENTGNSHQRKEFALRQAQKTANMNDLVKNLKLVKEMKFNYPVFNPAPEYCLLEGSHLIVIETRDLKVEEEARESA